MKAQLGLWFVLGLFVLALVPTAQSAHLPNCLGHDETNPCEAPTVPKEDANKKGTLKVVPQAPKAPTEPSLLDQVGAFFGAIGKGIGDGAGAIGSGVGAAFAGLGAGIAFLVRPFAELLAGFKPDGMSAPLYASMVATGTGAAVGGAQAGAWFGWKKLFPLGAPFLGLFSRIEKDELLENERRARIFELIKNNPGIHLSEIARELDFAWGTTLHHLRKLRADRLIMFKSIGHHKSFFVNGSGLSEKQMEAMSLIKNGTLSKLVLFLESHPRVSLKELSEGLGISPPLAAFHVRKLEKAGLVTKVREGKSVRLTTSTGLPAGFFQTLNIVPPVPEPVGAAS